MAVTKRMLVGIQQRLESAISRLPKATHIDTVLDIVERDLISAKEDIDYALTVAD